MYSSLRSALSHYAGAKVSWNQLVLEAERQGVAPLLYKHVNAIDFALPDRNARRLLQSLFLRSRYANGIRNTAGSEILAAFQREDIAVLPVKGIALCHLAYSATELRPMRDIDLLVKKVDLAKAEQILLELGYRPDDVHDITTDYYHLVPLTRTIDGLPVSIELHHNLLPFHPLYPLWPLEKSYPTAMTFSINEHQARTLSLEDSLWYVYLHGFRAPLTYEEFRFVHVADIITIVERYLDRIDWRRVRSEFPQLLNILSRFHFLTPWQDQVVNRLGLPIGVRTDQPGMPYRGWPQRRLKTVKTIELAKLIKHTLWPSQWWVQVYYGHLLWSDYMKMRLIEHPRTLWRWFKVYWHSYFRNSTN